MSFGEQEFMECGVNDKREAKSIVQMADRLIEKPELSFSSAVGDAWRRAPWRIFSKLKVDMSLGLIDKQPCH